jgi:hypothetical protein
VASLLRRSQFLIAPSVFLNLRVFSHLDDPFYQDAEFFCMSVVASRVLTLSKIDADSLEHLFLKRSTPSVEWLSSRFSSFHNSVRLDRPNSSKPPLIRPLLPPLRAEVQQAMLAVSPSGKTCGKDAAEWRARRKYITCCVRLSPEKEAEFFPRLIRALGVPFLRRVGLVPVLCGAIADTGYAAKVSQDLLDADPESVILAGKFLSSANLYDLFSQTALNVHPSRYDAFGMTIVEAAVACTPTFLNATGVGALELLGAEATFSAFPLTADPADIAKYLHAALASADKLRAVAANAQQLAAAWTLERYADQLSSLLGGEAVKAAKQAADEL